MSLALVYTIYTRRPNGVYQDKHKNYMYIHAQVTTMHTNGLCKGKLLLLSDTTGNING